MADARLALAILVALGAAIAAASPSRRCSVASLRTRDGAPLAGAHRGVVARQGRAIVWLVDFGPGPRRMQTPADVPRYASYARASARRLAAARWLK